MSGAALLFAAGGALYVGTITIGDDGVSTYGYASGGYGSISVGTYAARDGSARTINGVVYNTASGLLIFELTGSVSNSDTAAFTGVVINGATYLRSAATYSTPGGNSRWAWTPGSNVIGTSGTRVIILV